MRFFVGIWILARKEIKDSMNSPFIYILGALFSLIMGWLFFNYLALNKDLTRQSLHYTVFIPFFGNMNFIFLFLAPMMTMRLFSEEKKLHTIDLLLRSRLEHLQIILGKFCSALLSTLFLLSLTFIFPLVLSFSGYSNWSVVMTSYGGIVLSIMCYLAVGLFASSLTENQIVAAFLSFCILMGIMLLVITTNATNNQFISRIFYYISTPSHFESFTSGSFQSYDLVYFVSFIGFFFYLARLSLERRDW